jgi:hypothetical protein
MIISSQVLLKNVSVLGLAPFHPFHRLLDLAHWEHLDPWLNILLGSELLEQRLCQVDRPSRYPGVTRQHLRRFLFRPNARSSQTTTIGDDIYRPDLRQRRVGNTDINESAVDEQESERTSWDIVSRVKRESLI